jgi:alpha-L-rhamnosidase
VRNVSISDVKGTFGSFGTIEPNPGDEISDITLTNIDVTLKDGQLHAGEIKNFKTENVKVNGVAYPAKE